MTEQHLIPRAPLPAAGVDPACNGNEEDQLQQRLLPGGKPWRGDHPINIRLSIPVLGRRYYLTVVAGKERRSSGRLAFERRKHPLKTTGNILFLVVLGSVLGAGVLAIILLSAIAILKTNGALAAVP